MQSSSQTRTQHLLCNPGPDESIDGVTQYSASLLTGTSRKAVHAGMQWKAKAVASGAEQRLASKAASVQFYLIAQLGVNLSWRLQLAACSCSANLLALKVRIAPSEGCQACLQSVRHSMQQDAALSSRPCSSGASSVYILLCISPCGCASCFLGGRHHRLYMALIISLAQLQSVGISAVDCSR